MKRILSCILILAMILSFSVCAFATETDARVIPEEDKDLEPIPLPKDVSALDAEEGKIQLALLIDLPDPLKATARKNIKDVTAMGYKIHSGFGVWTESEEKTFCTIKLSMKDVPDGAVIFVNGNMIEPETRDNDGYDYFDVPLNTVPDKSVVLIAVREKKDVTPDGVTPDGSGDVPAPVPTHYPSPTYRGA